MSELHPSSRHAVWATAVRERLSALRLSATREAEIIEELSQHLDDRYVEAITRGAGHEEALRAALDAFQANDVLAQRMATLRQANAPTPVALGASTGRPFTDLQHDLRYAVRTFRKQRAFAFAAVLTLALGLGATTAIFSVVYGVLLKPLPFDEPESLVSVRQHAPLGAGTNQGPATYFTYRENQTAFEDIGAWDSSAASIVGAGDPERVETLLVSSTTLPLLRVQPLVGRLFSAEDDMPNNPPRVILTHGYWMRRLGGAENVVGQTLVVDGQACEVIGVLPSSFVFLRERPDVVLPLRLNPSAPRFIGFGFQALARLKPGVTLTQANADAARVLALLPPMFARLELRPNVTPLADEVVGDIGETLWILLAAVGVVLLIACGNVANLFLVRAEGRRRELAIRAALGASRARTARALLAESVVLALAGGCVGVALALAATRLIRAIAPTELPRIDDIAVDLPVLVFTLAVSSLSGVLFGLLAALRFGESGVAALKEGGRSASDTHGRHRTRNALVVGQVALSLTLLIFSGLMIRTFIELRLVDPGFDRPQEVQTFLVAIPPGVIGNPQETALTFEQISERLAQVPGVASVGLSTSITMDGEDNGNTIEAEGTPLPPGKLPPLRRFKSLGPGYLETMGIDLAAGRSITWGDVHAERPVALVSATIAREYWGEPSRALGQRIHTPLTDAPWYEVVGVVADERDDGLDRPPTPIVYWPMLNQNYQWRRMVYAVRSTRVGTPGFQRELEQAVWSVNPALPLANVQTLDRIQARSMARTSFALVMLAIAAGVALLIGAVGIYGVVAYSAAQRTAEIGVRMALGAKARDVRRLFLRHGLALATAGIVLGVCVSVVLTRALSALLFGVDPLDPLTYVIVSAALLLVALLATYLSSRGAARVDPIVALRADL
jgi:predicted permease